MCERLFTLIEKQPPPLGLVMYAHLEIRLKDLACAVICLSHIRREEDEPRLCRVFQVVADEVLKSTAKDC